MSSRVGPSTQYGANQQTSSRSRASSNQTPFGSGPDTQRGDAAIAFSEKRRENAKANAGKMPASHKGGIIIIIVLVILAMTLVIVYRKKISGWYGSKPAVSSYENNQQMFAGTSEVY